MDNEFPSIIGEHPSVEKVNAIETVILNAPQVDLNTAHALSGKVYARTIYIPAGTILTGAEHKKDHINIMQGDITVSTDEGMRRLTGHHIIETKAGNKRIGFAHADTVWTTVCYTEFTDIEDIENDLVETPEQLQTRNPALTNVGTAMIEGK